ncbi:hypothetical protein [Rubritalea tangerina]|uniref:hypothetical protein n=1 Tax=Rubritalea tangerina TaxID=430798 RepID=UPI003613A872
MGLRRAGFDGNARKEIKALYNLLFKSGLTMTEALAQADQQEWSDAASLLLQAAHHPSRKGIMMA